MRSVSLCYRPVVPDVSMTNNVYDASVHPLCSAQAWRIVEILPKLELRTKVRLQKLAPRADAERDGELEDLIVFPTPVTKVSDLEFPVTLHPIECTALCNYFLKNDLSQKLLLVKKVAAGRPSFDVCDYNGIPQKAPRVDDKEDVSADDADGDGADSPGGNGKKPVKPPPEGCECVLLPRASRTVVDWEEDANQHGTERLYLSLCSYLMLSGRLKNPLRAMQLFGKNFSKHTRLQFLSLADLKMFDHGAIAFLHFLPKDCPLEYIDLSGNCLTDTVFSVLAKCMPNCARLKCLLMKVLRRRKKKIRLSFGDSDSSWCL